MLADLVFLRPAWLLALLLLPLLAWAWRRRARRRSAWHAAVDPHLLPSLLGSGGGRGASWAGLAVLSGLAVAIVALAGPSWRSVPQPLQGGGAALVIALDLSSATLANDLPPSRLAQARARVDALLRAHSGDVALVAWADDAYVVSPVTSEAGNVAVFLDALAPDVMPVDGQRPERAIDLASGLLEQAGHARGDILLLAHAVSQAAIRAATRAAAAGHRVSVLAMGTPAGAGYRGRDGGIHHSALDMGSLRALAAAGGGHVYDWSASPSEVVAGLAGGGRAGAAAATRSGQVREDGGYWLLPLAMLLLLAAFRRGGLAVVALCLLLPLQPSLAADDASVAEARAVSPTTVTGTAAGQAADAPSAAAADAGPPAAGLWRRADQAAHARSTEAEAAYREGEFEAAARGFGGLPGADAAYNRGNALARAGRYEDALAAYDEALAAAPGMSDAVANRAAVEAAMRQESPPPDGAGSGDMPPQDDQRGDAGDDAGDRGDKGPREPDDDRGDPSEQPDQPSDAPPEQAGADGDGDQQPPPPAAEEEAEARTRQQAADEAQRDAMQRALESGGDGDGDGEPEPTAARQESSADTEREQANAAWLRRVPDDPGALLRARFRNEYLRRRAEER